MKNKQEKKCLHVMAHKAQYQDGEALTCSKCGTVIRFTTLDNKVMMFPLGGSMTTASNIK